MPLFRLTPGDYRRRDEGAMSPSTGPESSDLQEQAKGLCDQPKADGGEHKPDEGGSERSEACCATRRSREHRSRSPHLLLPQSPALPSRGPRAGAGRQAQR